MNLARAIHLAIRYPAAPWGLIRFQQWVAAARVPA